MILITGSSGFIGSNLINFFLKKKIKFIAIDKKKNRYIKINNFKKINLLNTNKLIQFLKIKKPKIIIHLAAMAGLNNCHENKNLAYKNNVEATFNLLNAANIIGCKRVLIASSFATTKFESKPSFYGFTKKICEQMVFTFKENFGLNVSTIRFSNVYGPFSKHKSSAIHSMIKSIIKKKLFLLHGTGLQKRDFIFVEDLILKIMKILKHNYYQKEYDINSKYQCSVLDIKKILEKISFKKLKIRKIQAPSGYDVDYNFKKGIINKKLIFGLKKTYNWYNSSKS